MSNSEDYLRSLGINPQTSNGASANSNSTNVSKSDQFLISLGIEPQKQNVYSAPANPKTSPSTQPKTADVQTWGSKPESEWVTEKAPSTSWGTTTLRETQPKQETETEKRIKELQAQLAEIKQNSAYDLTGSHDWASDRKKVEDELRSLGDTSVDRGKNILGGWLDRTGGSYVNAAAYALDNSVSDQMRNRMENYAQYGNERAQENAAKSLARIDEREAKYDEWDLHGKGEGLINQGNQKIETAKDGLNGVGRLAVDLGLGALDLGADAVANTVVPGSGLALMGTRVFSQEAKAAKDRGLSEDQQILAGIKGAAIEVLTEKIGGPFEKIYGKTALGKATTKAIEKASQNAAVRSALKLGSDFFSEASEEIISGLANVWADKLLKLDPEANVDVEELLYDGLVGGLLGLAGGAVNPQTWNSMTPAQKAQVVQQAADAAIEQSGVMTKSYSAQANEILRDPAKKAEFVAKHGELSGSNTEQAKAIAQILYNEATRPAQQTQQEPAQPQSRPADLSNFGNIPDTTTQYNSGTVTTPAPNTDSYVRGLLMDITPANANEILRNPEYRASFERVTGKKLSGVSNNQARNIILNSAITPGTETGITSGYSDAFSSQNESTMRYTPTPADTVQQIVNDATQPKAQSAQSSPSVAEQIVNDAINGVPPTSAQNAAGAQAQQGDITTAPTQQNASMDAPVELNSQQNNGNQQQTANAQQVGAMITLNINIILFKMSVATVRVIFIIVRMFTKIFKRCYNLKSRTRRIQS